MSKTANTTTPTAATAYAAWMRSLEGQVQLLQDAMREHKQRQAKQPLDWGYAGDAQNASAIMTQVLTALGQ